MEPETRHDYKVYNGSNFLGLLPNVKSPFNYDQAINNAGSQLDIEIGVTLSELGADVVTDELVDQDGVTITDQNGVPILLSLIYQFNSPPIELNNRIVVTEFSKWHPNGITVFDGLLYDVDAGWKDDSIKLKVLSHGTRFDHYIVDPNEDVAIVQSDFDSDFALPAGVKEDFTTVGQTFTPAADFLLSTIGVYMKTTSATALTIAWLWVYEGDPSISVGSNVGFGFNNTMQNTTNGLIEFTLPSPIQLVGGQTYFFQIYNGGAETSFYGEPSVAYKNSSVYAGGQMFTSTDGGTFGGGTWTPQTADVGFVISEGTGSVAAQFQNFDPSDIVKTAVRVFNAKGGLVTYSDDSVDDTGLSLNYTFLLATVLETITKGYQLAPSSWYWYVDVATNLVHLHDTPTIQDHDLILGKHLEDFRLRRTLEGLKNYVYLTGGENSPGVNLFRSNSDPASIGAYGQWLERITDNRITNEDTADIYTSARLGRYSQPSFNVTCIISAASYDISSIDIGQTIKIHNAGELVDSLILQIVSKKRSGDNLVLQMGIPFVRNTKLVDDLQRRMLQLETVNNPETVN